MFQDKAPLLRKHAHPAHLRSPAPSPFRELRRGKPVGRHVRCGRQPGCCWKRWEPARPAGLLTRRRAGSTASGGVQ